MDITPFFKLMIERQASDLFFSVGTPPQIKIEGMTAPVGKIPFKSQQMSELAASLMDDDQRREFDTNMELNMAISLTGMGRFRVNLFRQRGEIAMVVSRIQGLIPKIDDLHLPAIVKDLVMETQGLVLVIGATGSGKSTTLAAMLDHRNENQRGHILTIEDPIEYLYRHKKSIVNQREVGLDTLNFDNALKNVLRESVDVVFISEIRNRNILRDVLSCAESGHLCLSTLRSINAEQALERAVNMFSRSERAQVLQDLSINLKAIIALRLVSGISGQVPAVEILVNTPEIAALIENDNLKEVKTIMARSAALGMQTFEQALLQLASTGQINA